MDPFSPKNACQLPAYWKTSQGGHEKKHQSTTVALGLSTMEKRLRYMLFRAHWPHHLSCQKEIGNPFPTFLLIPVLTVSLIPNLSFQKGKYFQIPCEPYFEEIRFFQTPTTELSLYLYHHILSACINGLKRKCQIEFKSHRRHTIQQSTPQRLQSSPTKKSLTYNYTNNSYFKILNTHS